MHITASLTAFLTLLTISISAPTQPQKRSFKVLRPRSAPSTLDGPTELSKAYRKYGWSVPESTNSRIATSNLSSPLFQSKAATGSSDTPKGTGNTIVPATTGEADVQFLSPVKIGGQELNLDFDTGSSDLWVFSNKLTKAEIGRHTAYDPSKSKTFKEIPGASFQIKYGDKSHASGVAGFDEVNIGGAVVKQQAIELATLVSGSFLQDAESDGLLGLGSSKINTIKPEKQKTFFDSILPTLKMPLFTANLRHHTAGAYEFGNIDTDQYKGDLHFSDCDPDSGFWQFESKLFAIGDDTSTQYANELASPAIADTGTTLLLMDNPVVQKYYSHVKGAINDEAQGGYTFPCNTHLPDLHIQLAPGFLGRIPGELIAFSGNTKVAGGRCFGGLQSNREHGVQIFGDVMFKSMFTVFEQKGDGGRRVGFAPHA